MAPRVTCPLCKCITCDLSLYFLRTPPKILHGIFCTRQCYLLAQNFFVSADVPPNVCFLSMLAKYEYIEPRRPG